MEVQVQIQGRAESLLHGHRARTTFGFAYFFAKALDGWLTLLRARRYLDVDSPSADG